MTNKRIFMEYGEAVNPYLYRANFIVKNTLFKLAPIYRAEFGNSQDVTVPLFTSLHSTSECIIMLLENQAIFDAEVFFRTVMEGILKYCYLLNGTTAEKDKRYSEYKFKLYDIARVQDHYRAKEAIEIIKNFSTHCTEPIEAFLLDDVELSELENKYNKKTRAELNYSWSYQKLLCKLAKIDELYEAQLGTIFSYSFSSHLFKKIICQGSIYPVHKQQIV